LSEKKEESKRILKIRLPGKIKNLDHDAIDLIKCYINGEVEKEPGAENESKAEFQ